MENLNDCLGLEYECLKSIPEYLRKSYLYTSNATCEFCDPANGRFIITTLIENMPAIAQLIHLTTARCYYLQNCGKFANVS